MLLPPLLITTAFCFGMVLLHPNQPTRAQSASTNHLSHLNKAAHSELPALKFKQSETLQPIAITPSTVKNSSVSTATSTSASPTQPQPAVSMDAKNRAIKQDKKSSLTPVSTAKAGLQVLKLDN